MKKYLGIVRLDNYVIGGLNTTIKVKMYDNLDDMNKWFKHYYTSAHILLENSEELENFYNLFYDNTPISEEEINNYNKAKKLYKKIMED